MIILLLIVSVLMNVLLIWYIKKTLEKLLFVSDNIGDLLDGLEAFSTHVEGLHELETYYGDTTLQGLIHHSKQLVEEVKQYRPIYELTMDEEYDDNEPETEEEESQ